jgi:hypothetical protein
MSENTAALEARVARIERELEWVKSLVTERTSQQVAAPIETYSDVRIAEFLLSNATDSSSYDQARTEVRQMGLDPDKIDHWTPAGGW